MEYMLRVDDLRAFVAVGEAGSLMAAAQRLAISQPTLSKAMARLERSIGATLLERRARGVTLTEAGELLLRHVRDINLSVQDATAAIRDLRHGMTGTVRIGIGFAVPRSLVVASCRASHVRRKVSIEIRGGMTDSLLRAVANGGVDFAVCGIHPSRNEGVAWRPLFEDPMIPVAPLSNRLTGLARTTWAQLAEETWLVPSTGTATRTWFEKLFIDRKMRPPQRIIGVRNYPRAFDLGEALDAISLAPASSLKTALDSRSHRALKPPSDWKSGRVVGVLYRRRGYLSPAAEQLMRSFQAETANLGF